MGHSDTDDRQERDGKGRERGSVGHGRGYWYGRLGRGCDD